MNGELSTHVLMFCLGFIDEKENAERRCAAVSIQRIFRGRRGKWLWKRERLKQRVERRCGKLLLGTLYGYWIEKCAERRLRHWSAQNPNRVARRSITVVLVTEPSGRVRRVKMENVLILRASKVFERYHPMVSNFFMSQVDTSAFERFEPPYWIANPGSKRPPSRLVQWFRRERLHHARQRAVMQVVQEKNAATTIQNAWRCRASRSVLAQLKFGYQQYLHGQRVRRRAENFEMLGEDRRSAKLRLFSTQNEAAAMIQDVWRKIIANRKRMNRQILASVARLPQWISSCCSRAWYFIPSTTIQSWWRGLRTRIQNKERKRKEEVAQWKQMARQRRLVFAARIGQRYWRGVRARRYARDRKAGHEWITANPFYIFKEKMEDVLDPISGKLARSLQKKCPYDPAFPEMGMGVVAWFTRLGLREHANLFLDAGFETMQHIFDSIPTNERLFESSQNEELARRKIIARKQNSIPLGVACVGNIHVACVPSIRPDSWPFC